MSIVAGKGAQREDKSQTTVRNRELDTEQHRTAAEAELYRVPRQVSRSFLQGRPRRQREGLLQIGLLSVDLCGRYLLQSCTACQGRKGLEALLVYPVSRQYSHITSYTETDHYHRACWHLTDVVVWPHYCYRQLRVRS